MSAEGEPPAKKTRKRSREASEETAAEEKQETPKYQRGDVWFDDGNIVLFAQHTGFRIYRGLLAAQSTVFADMFVSTSSTADETLEGCPVVYLTDSGVDLAHLLRILSITNL